MRLTISNEALGKLTAIKQPNTKVLLSFDDGVGPFSSFATCSLNIAFQVVLVDADSSTPDYQAVLPTNAGNWYYKGYSATYLGEHLTLTLDKRYQTLILASENEQIDRNVRLVDLRTKATVAQS